MAWDELLSASSQLHSAANYRHDLVDVTRQALQVLGGDLYGSIVAAFTKRNITLFQYVLSVPDLLIQGDAEPTDTFQMVIDNIWRQGKISETVYNYGQVCYLLPTDYKLIF